MNEFEAKIGYEFRDKTLLRAALTHTSYANERKLPDLPSNERLEFLGDSILGCTVAEYLYRNRPKMTEGQMTRLRAELVCEKSLYSASEQLGIGEYLLLGKGEEFTGGRERPALLADAVEALLAAVFLDGGREEAVKLIKKYILSNIGHAEKVKIDYKTALQELSQRMGKSLNYVLEGEDGPDHEKVFTVAVLVGDERMGEGEGRNKKEAEQQAASVALERLAK
ncbi:MAG: ribonuclease III [Oscillospiraceae bacterium]|jgi:ribonuclease-3|nr:ribonuclease III [Oscillospiraceae bacterium]